MSSLGSFTIETLEELKKAECSYLEDMVYRFQLTYEIVDILDPKNIPTKRTGYSVNPGLYEVVDLNNTLKYNLPDNVKVCVTTDDVRLKINLKINLTLFLSEKSLYNFRFFSITLLSFR